ncbi:porphobilinogen deaminase [Durotheca rogersii]|uniref:porphobilinogen deaminase n=1 Tax=Durotheca rogersii TaxID=419775 RepID=UPI00221F9CC8|nr:porphobilinogen deaminase [Durotheca rogersii]KAI5859450.1 porphobilinogen deaminase [Durotheca rogersii]
MSTATTDPIVAPSPAPPAKTVLRIGTRKSILAMKQVDIVIEGLRRLYGDAVSFEVQGISPAADVDKVTALYNFGGKGVWTNELEAELRAGAVDIVVHSLKDMPTELPEGLVLACVPAREDARDVVVLRRDLEGAARSLADLPAGAVVGTSSIRRMAQVRRRHAGLAFADVRGNIDTRLRKLDAAGSPYAALVLAAAGLLRMGQRARIAQFLDGRTPAGGGMLHAVGQGGIGIEARADDAPTLALLRPLESAPARLACEAERSVMRTLEGGCSIPIGVETAWVGDGDDDNGGGETPAREGDEKKKRLRLTATVVSVDGTQAADADEVAPAATIEEAVAFGERVARTLVANGAQTILDAINADRERSQGAAKPWAPA